MISTVKEDPLTYYNRKLNSGFEQLEKYIYEVIWEIYDSIVIKDHLIDLEEMNIKGPTSSRTYIVHDGAELQNFFGGADAIGAAAFAAPLFFLSLLTGKFSRHEKDRSF
jgi:preprotein translocase subunit SecA